MEYLPRKTGLSQVESMLSNDIRNFMSQLTVRIRHAERVPATAGRLNRKWIAAVRVHRLVRRVGSGDKLACLFITLAQPSRS